MNQLLRNILAYGGGCARGCYRAMQGISTCSVGPKPDPDPDTRLFWQFEPKSQDLVARFGARDFRKASLTAKRAAALDACIRFAYNATQAWNW